MIVLCLLSFRERTLPSLTAALATVSETPWANAHCASGKARSSRQLAGKVSGLLRGRGIGKTHLVVVAPEMVPMGADRTVCSSISMKRC
jgi:hypothetical protein